MREIVVLFWVDDVTKEEPELREYRFTRVGFASPFLLNAILKYHLEQFLESNEVVVKRLMILSLVPTQKMKHLISMLSRRRSSVKGDLI